MFSPWLIFSGVAGDASPFSPEDFLNKLFPNVWSFLINFIALIVLFVVVYFVAYKPLKKLVNKRKDYVERNLRDSEQAKSISERKAKEADKLIEDASIKADEIIEKAGQYISREEENFDVHGHVWEQISKRQQDADIAIKQAEEKSRQEMHDEIVNLALDASKQVLKREVNEKDNKDLVNDFVEGMNKEKDEQ